MLRALIVDDEPHAIEIIEDYVRQVPAVELVGQCRDGMEAFLFLQQHPVDLLFLDVNMPALSGIGLLRSLKNPPKVIMVTAFLEYAAEGFELDVVDYLLKPVSFDRFLRAMDKVFRLGQPVSAPGMDPGKPTTDKEVFLYLKVDRKVVKINTGEVLWVESLRDYIRVVTKQGEYTSKQKISIVEELLPEHRFLRIHRSFIVCVTAIHSVHGHCVEIGGKELPVGRNYKAGVQKRLKESF